MDLRFAYPALTRVTGGADGELSVGSYNVTYGERLAHSIIPLELPLRQEPHSRTQ